MSICASIYSSIWQHAVCRQITYEVRLFLLPLLRDFEETGSFSWDSVVLGCLYRKLCQATSLDSSQIANPLVFLQVKDNCHPQLPDIILLFQKHAQLLQTWTWERIHVGCPQRLMLWRARHSSELICLTIPWHASEKHPVPGSKTYRMCQYFTQTNWTGCSRPIHLATLLNPNPTQQPDIGSGERPGALLFH